MTGQAGVASRLAPLLERLIGGDLPVRIRAWDGTEVGPVGAPLVVVRSRRALRRLLWEPNELGLSRAYVAGELDLEGDIFAPLEMLSIVVRREDSGGLGLTAAERREFIKGAVRLGAVGPQPKPPPEEVVLSGRKHSKGRDRAAISHHYDVGNDFYRLVLGPSMVYSCAYWALDGPSYTLEDAQRDKLELVCRKLGLRSGMRLLDVGCGWGSLAIHAAEHHAVHVVGVTLSREQADYARKRVAEAGLTGQVDIRLQDYRDVEDGPFDAIASIGMAEHVGEEAYTEYASHLYRLLTPGGRFLNHQISQRVVSTDGGPSFIQSYVFPDGDLRPVGTTVTLIEDAGFEVRDVEALREHYAKTLRSWVSNLEANWDEAVRLSSAGRARVWRLYMAGSALSFEAGHIGVNQILAVKRRANGSSEFPATRKAWLGVG
jgi:cyclopropane-fatty-acyl-phospholipid synthase